MSACHARCSQPPGWRRDRGIDRSQPPAGSGPRGRIVKRDIPLTTIKAAPNGAEEAAAAKPQAERRLVPSRPAAPAGLSDQQVLAMYEPGSYELVPHDTMRRVIAERLTLAKQTIPHFYLSIDCRLDALLAARTRLNAMRRRTARAPSGSRSTISSSRRWPWRYANAAANATWTEEGILLHRASDIAVAVALEGGGLYTPVIRNAEIKSLSEISNEMRDLATRARSKRLAPHEYQGGTTTISNLGMYGIDRFDAVINPPQARSSRWDGPRSGRS